MEYERVVFVRCSRTDFHKKEAVMKDSAKNLGVLFFIVLLIAFVVFPGAADCQTKDKIRIGNAISLSGPYSAGAITTQIGPYDMWVKEVNAKGGIYVKEYNKKLPIEIIRYDDKSDIGNSVKLVEKLILDDKVDLLLPPWGTATNFAIAPVVTKYEYPVLGVTVDSMKIKEIAPTIPYFFVHLNQPPVKAAAIVPLLKELGVKTAAVIHHADLHGIEFAGYVTPQLSVNGIDVVLYRTYPLGAKDLSPLLKKIKAAKPDAVLAFTYPPETFLITQQARTIGLNPKLFYLSIGTAFAAYRDAMGVKTVEGVMGTGAWNPKVPYPGAKEFWDRMIQAVGPGKVDWYGNAFAYSSCQVLEQAIEKAGTLDRKKLREVIASNTFQTVIGPVRYEGQINVQSPGEVGQWQNGQFEIVAAKEKRTAKPIYPKPAWSK